MNCKQRVLTWAALTLFVATLVFTPWRISVVDNVNENKLIPSDTWFRPLVAPPRTSYTSADVHFRLLLCEWFAIGVVYAALFALFKSGSQPNDHESPRRD